jgi:ubiquinone/menaquinone biosynthesis C-methylase UbiE
MIRSARRNAANSVSPPTSFEVADLDGRMVFPNEYFGHCINVSVLQLVQDPLATLTELWRVLKPDGTLLVLHVPRETAKPLSVREAFSARWKKLETKTLWQMVLVFIKVYAERTSLVKHWTEQELREMLFQARFLHLETVKSNPILIVAQKITSNSVDRGKAKSASSGVCDQQHAG